MIPFCFGLIFAMVFVFLFILFSLFGVDLLAVGVIFSFVVGVLVGIYVIAKI